MYEIKGFYGKVIGMFVVGLLLVLIGLIVYSDRDVSPAAGVFLMVIGGLTVLSCVRVLVTWPPLVRATADGIRFSGSAVIPWTAIKQIYVGSFDVRASGLHARTSSIAFDFHHRRTLFRLPVSMWMSTPFGVGDVDVSPHATADNASVIVAKLEAMRVRALGTEEGVTAGGSELPAARVVEHERGDREDR